LLVIQFLFGPPRRRALATRTCDIADNFVVAEHEHRHRQHVIYDGVDPSVC